MPKHILKKRAVNPESFITHIDSYCNFEKGMSQLDAMHEFAECQQSEGTCHKCLKEKKKFEITQLRKK
jgi:hypothetical protein